MRSAQLTRCLSVLALAAAFLGTPAVAARAEPPQSSSTVAQKKVATRRRVSRASRALREAMRPRYKRDASGDLVPDVRAAG